MSMTGKEITEMQKKYIDIAYAKSKRLEKLIEDLFGFTKMNYGKVAMHVTVKDILICHHSL